MNNQDYNNYIIRKFFSSIVFNTDKKINSVVDWFYDVDVLMYLEAYVELFCKHGFFNQIVKSNVYEFLFKAREIKDKDYEKRIEIINNIIINLNSSKLDKFKYINFYRNQLAVRRNDKKFLNNYSDEYIESIIDLVNTSICVDMFVINTHSKQISEEEFEFEYLSKFINNSLYYESLNVILYEFPELFKNPIFYNRVMKVINKNNDIIEDKRLKKINNKLIKKIKKYK